MKIFLINLEALPINNGFIEVFVPKTIYDVARHAGVGIATVSRALNNNPNINKATKEKILRIASELNYTPHGLARGLARKQTHQIATVVPFFFNYFFLGLLKNIQYQLTTHNYDLFLYSVDRIDNKNIIFERVLSERKCDGVLILSLGMDDLYAEKFLRAKMPVILVDNYHSLLDSISIANLRGSKVAVKHLISRGYHKIALINGSLSSYPAKIRLEGYKETLYEHHIPYRPEYVVNATNDTAQDGFNESAGYDAMQKLISLEDSKPEAVFVASDVQALGALRAAKEYNIRIPEDIAMIGFDDIDFVKYVGLTTMRQPVQSMAELAVNRLLQRINKKTSDKFQVELNAELVIRETCGCNKGFHVNSI